MCITRFIFAFFLVPILVSPALGAGNYVQPHFVPQPYLAGAGHKLTRGVANIVTSPVEIPKQLYLSIHEEGAAGTLPGVVRGLGMLVVRIGVGIVETVSFVVPNEVDFSGETDYSFAPILAPTYVWQGWHPPVKK